MQRAWPDRLLVLAGVITWLAVGAPVIQALVVRPHALRALVWIPSYLGYGALFWVGARLWMAGRAGVENGYLRWCPRLLAGQTVLALVLAYAGSGTTEGALLVIVASALPFLISRGLAAAWVLGASAAFAGVLAARGQPALVPALAFLGFQAFAAGAALLAESEARAREQLARTHAELVATQHLLAESSRLAERVRISRDLHDSLGHYLSAVAMNLEAAAHLVDGKPAELVGRARDAAAQLLGEVRQAVSPARDDCVLDLGTALATLASGVSRPRVELTLGQDVRICDVAHAQAIFRCVQEVITNAVKHAGAARLRIEVTRRGSRLEVQAEDDGRGAARVEPGTGLRGMRQRFEELGGELAVAARPGRGFAVHGWVPVGGSA